MGILMNLTFSRVTRLALGWLVVGSLVVPGLAHGVRADRPLFSPLPGSLILAGEGKLPQSVLFPFLVESGGRIQPIVLLSSTGELATSPESWERAGAQNLEVLQVESGAELREDEPLLALTAARGLWLEDVSEELWGDPLFQSLVRSVLQRGGAVGGAGQAATRLASHCMEGEGQAVPSGLGLLASSLVTLGGKRLEVADLRKALTRCSGTVGWALAKESALVVHQGRRVSAMGEGEVIVMLAGQGDWPERVQRLEALGLYEYGKEYPSGPDLLALQRSAVDREGPLFPPVEAPSPRVAKGSLLLHGGGGVDEEIFKRFIREAGGKKAPIVCIPSGNHFAPGRQPDSYSAGELRDLGCKNVTVLHTASNQVANLDEAFLEPLKKAKGVWMDGGRTYRLMDTLQGTRAHGLISEVLDRGGVVAGSSAGAQAIGDFLVRGNPHTNKQLVFEGYTTGLGLIEGVIIDAHFRQRERGEAFAELMGVHRQMLGIGLDEKTSLLIRGTKAEVLGENRVSFYDYSRKKARSAAELEAGEVYDLKTRSRRK